MSEPDSDPPPSCDPPCQKIILDGDTLESAAADTCEMLVRMRDSGQRFTNPTHVVEALIKAERATFHVQRVALEEIGYTGPWPDHLKGTAV